MKSSSKFRACLAGRQVQGSGFRVVGPTPRILQKECYGQDSRFKIRNQQHLLFAVFILALVACSGKSENNDSVKFRQYYNQGELLYEKNCSNCHQKNGVGLGRVYPPLHESDYMKDYFADVICLMRNGKRGELKVNGVSFNQPMPGIPSLTDLEIAEIATYIYNSWSHQRGIVEVKEVSKIIEVCPPSP